MVSLLAILMLQWENIGYEKKIAVKIEKCHVVMSWKNVCSTNVLFSKYKASNKLKNSLLLKTDFIINLASYW